MWSLQSREMNESVCTVETCGECVKVSRDIDFLFSPRLSLPVSLTYINPWWWITVRETRTLSLHRLMSSCVWNVAQGNADCEHGQRKKVEEKCKQTHSNTHTLSLCRRLQGERFNRVMKRGGLTAEQKWKAMCVDGCTTCCFHNLEKNPKL